MTDDTVTLEIAAPDDWHVHLRDDEMLSAVTPYTANVFRHAVVMPNINPPVTSTQAAAAYRARVLAAAGPDARHDFTPMMVLYLNDQIVVDDLLAAQPRPVAAVPQALTRGLVPSPVALAPPRSRQ